MFWSSKIFCLLWFSHFKNMFSKSLKYFHREFISQNIGIYLRSQIFYHNTSQINLVKLQVNFKKKFFHHFGAQQKLPVLTFKNIWVILIFPNNNSTVNLEEIKTSHFSFQMDSFRWWKFWNLIPKLSTVAARNDRKWRSACCCQVATMSIKHWRVPTGKSGNLFQKRKNTLNSRCEAGENMNKENDR